MVVTASAPGKLVLLGEYAVLEGAPALVLAVDRRAQVRIAARDDGHIFVHAPDLDIRPARAVVHVDGLLHWQCSVDDAAKLGLVEHVWRDVAPEQLSARMPGGFDLQLDTGGFFHGDGRARAKLGLGSSAALTVALATALASCSGRGDLHEDRVSWLRRLLRIHDAWQDGRGSGVDVAASAVGGLIAYRRLHGEPELEHLSWPLAGVQTLFVWSGHAVSTANFLQRLAQWRATQSDEYAAHMHDMTALAHLAVQAVRGARVAHFIELVAEYGAALRNFSAACGLEIYSPAQTRLARLAAQIGVSYKPCGAGGDFGVVFSDDTDRMSHLAQHIAREEMHTLPLRMDTLGLQSQRSVT